MGSIVNGLFVGIGRWGDLLVTSTQKENISLSLTALACTRANVEEFCINRNINLTDDYATVLKKKIARI